MRGHLIRSNIECRNILCIVMEYSKPSRGRLKRFFFGSNFSSNGLRNAQSLRSLRERRPLKIPVLKPPEYLIDCQVFIDSYVELETQFIGELKDVDSSFDISSRLLLLSTIDQAKACGKLPWLYDSSHDSALSLSFYNVKLMNRDTEELQIRIPTHEISALSFVRDGPLSLVVLKICQPLRHSNHCSLVLLRFIQSRSAEECCALFKQLFSALYTECAACYLSDQQQDTQDSHLTSRFSLRSENSTSLPRHHRLLPDSLALPKSSSLYHCETPPLVTSTPVGYKPLPQSYVMTSHTLPRNTAFTQRTYVDPLDESRRRTICIPEDDISSPEGLVTQFLLHLRKQLSQEELRLFGQLLRDYRSDSRLDLFLTRLVNSLHTENRAVVKLLRPFIPPSQLSQFDVILSEEHLSPNVHAKTLSAPVVTNLIDKDSPVTDSTKMLHQSSILSQDSARGASAYSSASQLSVADEVCMAISTNKHKNELPAEFLEFDSMLDELSKEMDIIDTNSASPVEIVVGSKSKSSVPANIPADSGFWQGSLEL